MATFKTFEDIEAWQLSRELTNSIYKVTSQGTFAKDFGLRNQIREASVSIMSNIAEGFERSGTKEFIQFLSTAKGSAGEVRAQLYVALDQGYLERAIFDDLSQSITKISMMPSGLITYLIRTDFKGTKFKRSNLDVSI
ncbi:MAG: four helix bundle protein [Pyrinomonadaceae bacterium]